MLCPEGDLWVDVDAFEEAVATARRSREPGAYRAAIELYTGSSFLRTATRSGLKNSVPNCEHSTLPCSGK